MVKNWFIKTWCIKIGVLKIGVLKLGVLKICVLKLGVLKIGVLKITIKHPHLNSCTFVCFTTFLLPDSKHVSLNGEIIYEE